MIYTILYSYIFLILSYHASPLYTLEHAQETPLKNLSTKSKIAEHTKKITEIARQTNQLKQLHQTLTIQKNLNTIIEDQLAQAFEKNTHQEVIESLSDMRNEAYSYAEALSEKNADVSEKARGIGYLIDNLEKKYRSEIKYTDQTSQKKPEQGQYQELLETQKKRLKEKKFSIPVTLEKELSSLSHNLERLEKQKTALVQARDALTSSIDIDNTIDPLLALKQDSISLEEKENASIWAPPHSIEKPTFSLKDQFKRISLRIKLAWQEYIKKDPAAYKTAQELATLYRTIEDHLNASAYSLESAQLAKKLANQIETATAQLTQAVQDSNKASRYFEQKKKKAAQKKIGKALIEIYQSYIKSFEQDVVFNAKFSENALRNDQLTNAFQDKLIFMPTKPPFIKTLKNLVSDLKNLGYERKEIEKIIDGLSFAKNYEQHGWDKINYESIDFQGKKKLAFKPFEVMAKEELKNHLATLYP